MFREVRKNYVTKMNYQALYGKDTSGTKKSHTTKIHKGIKVEESEMKNGTETEIPNEEKTPKQSADATEMNHECNFCPKTFLTESTLNTHIRTIHKSELKYKERNNNKECPEKFDIRTATGTPR